MDEGQSHRVIVGDSIKNLVQKKKKSKTNASESMDPLVLLKCEYFGKVPLRRIDEFKPKSVDESLPGKIYFQEHSKVTVALPNSVRCLSQSSDFWSESRRHFRIHWKSR